MDAKINKMRERLIKQGKKVNREQTVYAEMEREIKKAEDEHLGYLARSAANNLSGGMDELFELLRDLRTKPAYNGADGTAATAAPPKNSNETKEGVTVDDTDETDETEKSNG